MNDLDEVQAFWNRRLHDIDAVRALVDPIYENILTWEPSSDRPQDRYNREARLI